VAESSRRRPDSTKRLVVRVAQLCGAVRDILSARRVSVFVYDAASRTVSPLVSDRPDDDRLGETGRKWARIHLDDFPAARTVLLERQPIAIEDAQRDVRLPQGLAADFGTTSVHLEPLLTTEPVGMLAIEPASASRNPDLASIVPLVAASVARIQERRATETERIDDAIADLMEAAARERSVDNALSVICERVAQLVDARRAVAFLFEDGQALARVARVANGDEDREALERMRTADDPLPIVNAALEAGDAVIAEDPGSPLLGERWAETLAIGSAIAAPLGRRTEVLGVIVADSPDPRAFSDTDARLLAEAAGRVGPIVAMARTVEEGTSNLQAATAIRRLLEEGARAVSVEQAAETLARVTRDALGSEHASVFLADDEDRIAHVAVEAPEEFRRIATERLVGSPVKDFRLWRRVTRQRRPVFVEDASESQLIPAELVALLHLRSYVAFPLMTADRALGLVVCSDTRERREWTEEQKELVEQLALEGALVIENAGLRAQDRRRLDDLSRRAFHDPLTELPNRTLFRDRLEHALARTRRVHASVGVLLVDLDGFKEINDNFGHEAGDQVLVAVAQRLRASLRPADTVARLGGDEFTVLLEDITSVEEATRVAERIENSLRTPFMVEGHETSVGTSIGIAINLAGREDPSTLLRNADAAMYQAKRMGKGRHAIYTGPDREPGRVDLDDDLNMRGPRITGSPRDNDHRAGEKSPEYP
jgi:diguanylate cyclase (GGDEF)-like protein